MIVFAYFYARFIGDKGWLEWMWNLRRLWILGAGLLGLGYGVYYIISKQWVLWRKDGGK
ncbi:MAG: hypothetical protein HZA12_03575 [Nitrospirae bacterium]|nr:hypothetical protein [Nitrospirota bacterium]